MKYLLVLIFSTLCFSTSVFGQTFSDYGITKEQVCLGAAVSIVGNVKPWVDRGLSFSEIQNMIGNLVEPSIKNAPKKAYDLLKSGKSSEQVTAILKSDFMKIDDATILKGLLKPEDGDFDE